MTTSWVRRIVDDAVVVQLDPASACHSSRPELGGAPGPEVPPDATASSDLSGILPPEVQDQTISRTRKGMRTLDSVSHAEFERLVERVGPAMLRYARRRTDPETVQDVVAEALLVLWRRSSDIPSENEVAWAVGVTRGCLANAGRASRRQRSLAVRLTTLRESSSGAAIDEADDPTIHQALAKLREGDREVLRLWAWDDLTPAEIAAVLDIRVETVSVRLHRAKRRLAAALGTTAAPEIHARAMGRDSNAARKGTT